MIIQKDNMGAFVIAHSINNQIQQYISKRNWKKAWKKFKKYPVLGFMKKNVRVKGVYF